MLFQLLPACLVSQRIEDIELASLRRGILANGHDLALQVLAAVRVDNAELMVILERISNSVARNVIALWATLELRDTPNQHKSELSYSQWRP